MILVHFNRPDGSQIVTAGSNEGGLVKLSLSFWQAFCEVYKETFNEDFAEAYKANSEKPTNLNDWDKFNKIAFPKWTMDDLDHPGNEDKDGQFKPFSNVECTVTLSPPGCPVRANCKEHGNPLSCRACKHEGMAFAEIVANKTAGIIVRS